MTEPITKKVLDEIERKAIKPKAKWKFLLKRSVIQAAGIISLGIGAIASSVMLYMFIQNDWDLLAEIDGSFIQYVFATAPYVWIFMLLIFSMIAFYNVRNMEGGFRYRAMTILLGSIGLSLILGTGLYFLGFGQKIDTVFAEHIPYYATVAKPVHYWHNPEKGMLTGKIIVDAGEYRLRDIKGMLWELDFQQKEPDLEEGQIVHLIGKAQNKIFIVEILKIGHGQLIPPPGPKGKKPEYMINRQFERKLPLMRIQE